MPAQRTQNLNTLEDTVTHRYDSPVHGAVKGVCVVVGGCVCGGGMGERVVRHKPAASSKNSLFSYAAAAS